jgi:hypothetical protein
LGLVPAAIGSAGCGLTHLQDLSFRIDQRVHIVAPKDRSTVSTPVTLRWRVTDFDIEPPGSTGPTRRAGYFAIFVDRSPVHPGQTLAAVASGDPFCKRSAGCPDTAYLTNRQVYMTTATTFTLPTVDPIPGNNDRVQLHHITLILMNTAGRRIGESHWELNVRVRRSGHA